MRILITGGRNWKDYAVIHNAIIDQTVGLRAEEVTIVHGDARGADTIAGGVARKFGMTEESHPADWNTHHRAAGPIRNQKMVDLGADYALAFLEEGSKGTADCIKRIKKAGIPLTIYKDDGSVENV